MAVPVPLLVPLSEAPTLARLDRNLERWPLFPLDMKHRTAELEYREGDRLWRVWTRNPAGLPGPFGSDLWLALGALWNKQDPVLDGRTVLTSPQGLADVLGLAKGGTTWRQIRETLQSFMDVQIHAEQTLQGPGGARVAKAAFHLLEALYTVERDDTSTDTLAVVFSPTVAANLTGGMFRLLDMERYRAVEGPTARRLYRYLDLLRHRGRDVVLNELSVPLLDLKHHLPLASAEAWAVRRTLGGAHDELRRVGFLRGAAFPPDGRGMTRATATYVFSDGQTPSALPTPRADREEDQPEYLRTMVTECVRVLGDERSVAWYTKLAKAVPADTLRTLLSDIQTAKRENYLSADGLRRVFVRRATAAAAALGIAL